MKTAVKTVKQHSLAVKNISELKAIGKKYTTEKYTLNLIRRYIRKYKGSIPYSHSAKSFMIDADMYEYRIKDSKLYLYIQRKQII